MIPWALLAGLILAIAGTLGGYFYGVDVTDTEWEAATETKINEAVANARAEEQAALRKTNAILKKQLDRSNFISADLQRDVDQLRQERQSRRDVPDTPRPDCSGATGAELFGEDAVFLRRESARADQCLSDLAACYEWADEAVNACSGSQY